MRGISRYLRNISQIFCIVKRIPVNYSRYLTIHKKSMVDDTKRPHSWDHNAVLVLIAEDTEESHTTPFDQRV